MIETDGLLIKNVDYDDAGTYTCRARVLETGSLEERDIKLEVMKINCLLVCSVRNDILRLCETRDKWCLFGSRHKKAMIMLSVQCTHRSR